MPLEKGAILSFPASRKLKRLSQTADQANVHALGMGGKYKNNEWKQKRYIITSVTDVKKAAKAREQWDIENQLQPVPDMVCDDDYICRGKTIVLKILQLYEKQH